MFRLSWAHMRFLRSTRRADEYVDLVVEEMIPEVAEKKLARFCDVFCEKRGLHD